jgi:transposase
LLNCDAVKESLKLSEREFICNKCGYASNRDENAAKNIYRAGLAQIQDCGPEGSGQNHKILTKPAGMKQEL